MKMKALAALCGSTQNVFLVDEKNKDGEIVRQYIQTGYGVYPLDGMPIVDIDMLLTILDVPKDKWKSWNVNRADASLIKNYIEDNTPSDQEAELLGISLFANGHDVQPLYTPYGMVAIGTAYRKPIADSRATAQYFARKNPQNDQTIIAVKNGFMLVAAIKPVERWATEKTAECLKDVAYCAQRLVTKQQNEEAKNEAHAK